MGTGIHKVQLVRIELVTVDATYEIVLTDPDVIDLGGLAADLGLERDTMEMPSGNGWRKEIGLETATVTLKAHGRLKAERHAR